MLRRVTSAGGAGFLIAVVLLLEYAALPALVMGGEPGDPSRILISATMVGAAGILLGTYLPSGLPRVGLPRINVSCGILLWAVWAPFLIFIIVAYSTAPGIPLLAALSGRSSEEVAVLRENFLKARSGWQGSLVYVSAVLTGSLIPYTIALMFLRRMACRWYCFAFVLLYSISFVEKAYFLRVALPLFYLVAQGRVRTILKPALLLGAIVGVLVFILAVSQPKKTGEATRFAYFSRYYEPAGPRDFLIWRTVAVPLVTAVDALHVFEVQFDGRNLDGATSSLLAGLTGRERIPLERMVYEEQWGQNETETGSANSVFVTEAFINFGYPGVFVFGLCAGLVLRILRKSEDEALRSLWMLFCFGLFVSGLLGLLFSNGFAITCVLAILVKVGDGPTSLGPERGQGVLPLSGRMPRDQGPSIGTATR